MIQTPHLAEFQAVLINFACLIPTQSLSRTFVRVWSTPVQKYRSSSCMSRQYLFYQRRYEWNRGRYRTKVDSVAAANLEKK